MKLLPAILRRFSPEITYLDRSPVILNHDGSMAARVSEQQYGRVAILGKHTYHETVQLLPIADLKEIKAAVAMDPRAYAPFSTDLFFIRRIGRKQERSLVNLWFVRPEAAANRGLGHAWLTIPETALWSLKKESRPRLEIIDREESALMVHVDGAGGVRSTLGPPTEDSVEAFRRALGPEGCQCPTRRISSQRDYFKALMESLKEISAVDLLPFFRWRMDGGMVFTAKVQRALMGLAAMVLIYCALWLGLPYWKARQMTIANAQLSPGLSKALDRQEKISAIQTEIQMLARPVEEALPKLPVLEMLHDTLAQTAVINRLTMAGNRVEIQGQTDQGSAVISALTVVPGLSQVQLMAPLAKDRRSGKDQFTISFMILKEPFLNHMKTGKS